MEARIIELEKKVTYQDDMIETLNSIVTKQQDQIDALEQLIITLQDSVSQDGTISDTPPPHY